MTSPTPTPATPEHPAETAPAAEDIDIVDVWGHDSFPASDPPANW